MLFEVQNEIILKNIILIPQGKVFKIKHKFWVYTCYKIYFKYFCKRFALSLNIINFQLPEVIGPFYYYI